MSNNFFETTKHTKHTKELVYKSECYKIIGACFEVYRNMGSGFLEAVYQECLRKELQDQNIPFMEKPQLEVYYKEKKLDQKYEPDFVCLVCLVV
jgi:GxxExxY protein